MSSKETKSKTSGTVKSDLKTLGKYDIVRCIGAGGMGTVFLAQDRELKRTVALKVLPKERAENAILVRRFKAEGQAAAVLTHPNMVGVYEAGDADGYFYIALEYVDGTDVHNLLRKRHRIAVKRSLQIIRQISLALQHAHEKRLVHRDIKPANMLISRDGTVKLTDLGLARSLDNTLDTSITRDGTTVGTIDYMSPEQAADSKATDIRSDLYSLGCSWYHMLAGRPPFPDGDLTNKLAAHARVDPPDPRDFAENIPEAIVAVIHRLMAKRPADRYQTPAELLKELENPSILRTQDAHNLLAVLLAEDDDPEDVEDDSESLIVQEESQATLSAKKRVSKEPSPSSTIHNSSEFVADADSKHLSESMPIPVHEPQKIPKQKLPKQPKPTKKSKSTKKPSPKPPAPEIPESLEKTSTKRSDPKKKTDSPSAKKTTKPTKKSTTTKLSPETAQTQKSKSPEKKKSSRQEKKQSKRTTQKVQTKTKPQPVRTSLPPGIESQTVHEADSKRRTTPTFQIEFDWVRLSLGILIPLILVGLLWFAFTRFTRSNEQEENPYANDETNFSSSPLDGPPSNTANDSESNDGSKSTDDADDPVNTVIQAPVENEANDRESQRPNWMRPEWKSPQPNRDNTILVARGNVENGKNAPNLNVALSSIGKPDTRIDVSKVVRQSLVPQTIQVQRNLSIDGGTRNPVLVVDSSQTENNPEGWLKFSDGTVEIRGVHFVITESTTLFSLENTDLRLSDCSFTLLGSARVQLIDTQRSPDSQVFMNNCLVRGEYVTIAEFAGTEEFYAENSVFLSRKGTLWSVRGLSGLQTALIFRSCSILSGDTVFDLELPEKKSTRESAIRIGFDQCWIGGLAPELARAFYIRNLPDDLEPTPEILRERGLELTFVNHHFSPLGQYLETLSATGVSWTIGEHDVWNVFWGEANPPSGLAQFDTSDISNADLSLFNPTQLKSIVISDPEMPNLREGIIGAEPQSVAIIKRTDVVREQILHQLLDSKRPESTKGKEVRFDLTGNRRLQQFLDSDQCPNGTTIVCSGSGLVRFPVLKLVNRNLILRFESNGENPLQIQPANSQFDQPLITVEGGSLTIQQADVSLSRVRGSESSAQFVNVLKSGKLTINACLVEARYDDNIPLIRVDSNEESTLHVIDSMIKTRGPLLSVNQLASEINISNSILVSEGDLFQITGNQESARLLFDKCTVKHHGAFVDLGMVESNDTLLALVTDTVFANQSNSSEDCKLVSGPNLNAIKSKLNWYELNTAHVTTSMTLVAAKESLAGAIPKDWQKYWGRSRIVNVISGPKALLFEGKDLGDEQLTPKNFRLLSDCLASRWNDEGKPIGANISRIGPAPVPEKNPDEEKTPVRDKPPPAAF